MLRKAFAPCILFALVVVLAACAPAPTPTPLLTATAAPTSTATATITTTVSPKRPSSPTPRNSPTPMLTETPKPTSTLNTDQTIDYQAVSGLADGGVRIYTDHSLSSGQVEGSNILKKGQFAQVDSSPGSLFYDGFNLWVRIILSDNNKGWAVLADQATNRLLKVNIAMRDRLNDELARGSLLANFDQMNPQFAYVPDYKNLQPNFFPPLYHGESFQVIDDPTGTFSKATIAAITQPLNPGEGYLHDAHHRVYYPMIMDPSHPDGREVGMRGLPIVITTTINIQELGPAIGAGANYDRLLRGDATNGAQVLALAGDVLIPDHSDINKAFPSANNVLVQQSGRIYILPITHVRNPDRFILGEIIDPNAYLMIGQWAETRMVVTPLGIWTQVRSLGSKDWSTMGFVENRNPTEPEWTYNTGPYATGGVGSPDAQFRMLQAGQSFRSFGPAVPFSQLSK